MYTTHTDAVKKIKTSKYAHHKEKKKDSAGRSDDTASMIKGGCYAGACTRQPTKE
jgi:hypothetical protein